MMKLSLRVIGTFVLFQSEPEHSEWTDRVDGLLE